MQDLALTLKDLDVLEKVWTLTDEWNKTWEKWRTILFHQLDTQTLEEDALKVCFVRQTSKKKSIVCVLNFMSTVTDFCNWYQNLQHSAWLTPKMTYGGDRMPGGSGREGPNSTK